MALLRGINVGAHKRIAMADLRELLTSLGYGEVRTLLQSGNVALRAEVAPESLAAALEHEIAERFAVTTPVVVRTREQLAAVLACDPLREIVDEDRLYQVNFLSAEPTREAIERIEAVDFGSERFVHAGLEIYAWHPAGIHSSPLARSLTDKQLGVVATARNWNTTVKLLELASG